MAALLAEEHPELFHYTGINGLKGIIESQSLWATHSSFLNDATEVETFKKILPDILRPAIKNALVLLHRDPIYRARIEKNGGFEKTIEGLAIEFNDSLYEGFRKYNEDIYITSFCTHKNDEENKHGSLSQWRGYGQDGGYAIVFDGKLVDNFLAQERVNSGWYINSHRVAYSPFKSDQLSYEKFREELGEDLDVLSINIGKFFETQSPDLFEHLYAPCSVDPTAYPPAFQFPHPEQWQQADFPQQCNQVVNSESHWQRATKSESTYSPQCSRCPFGTSYSTMGFYILIR